LKLISNVTYGYTAAGYSGRMPCVEISDSVVAFARKTVENAIEIVNSYEESKGIRVIYGDTDSLFIQCENKSVEEAFVIGAEIAKEITNINPYPMELKFEKVYFPLVTLAKKRYCGYKMESVNERP
jgi:DNA polymerase zeta